MCVEQAAGDPGRARSCPLRVPLVSCLVHTSVNFALTSRDCAVPSEDTICLSAVIFCRAKSPLFGFLCQEGSCCRLVCHGSSCDQPPTSVDKAMRRALARFTPAEPRVTSVGMTQLEML